jgi:hypothetical protein
VANGKSPPAGEQPAASGPTPSSELPASNSALPSLRSSPPTAHCLLPAPANPELPAPRSVLPAPIRKIAFVAPHFLLDPGSEAARATLAGLHLLAEAGFECLALCATHFQAKEEIWVQDFLARQGIMYDAMDAKIGPYDGRMLFAKLGKVTLILFHASTSRGYWRDDREAAAFLTAANLFLTEQRPNTVWTYGADQVSLAVQQLAKRLDIPVVVAVHDTTQSDPAAFKLADYVIVPCETLRQHYWNTLGLASLILPPVVDAKGSELTPVYREFFAGITHQPGPPIMPQ